MHTIELPLYLNNGRTWFRTVVIILMAIKKLWMICNRMQLHWTKKLISACWRMLNNSSCEYADKLNNIFLGAVLGVAEGITNPFWGRARYFYLTTKTKQRKKMTSHCNGLQAATLDWPALEFCWRARDSRTTYAAFCPEINMAPNVGPYVGQVKNVSYQGTGLTYHAWGSVEFCQFHASDYHARRSLACIIYNS